MDDLAALNRFRRFLSELDASVAGDPHLRLLQSKLASGHVIQGVTAEERDGRAWYVFRLARLGASSSASVPAGLFGVEAIVADVRMETREDEQRRCRWRIQRAIGPLLDVVGVDAMGAALRGFAERSGAPASLAAARGKWPQVRTNGAAVDVLVRATEIAFEAEIARLAIDLGYELPEAAALADAGLSDLIATI